MVKLARGGMNHPRGEVHFHRGRGFFPRFPVDPPPTMGYPYFPRPFRPPPPSSARGRTLPGLVPPQFAQNPTPPIPPPPCGPLIPRGALPISPSGRPYHPRPIIPHQSTLPPRNVSFTPSLRKPVLVNNNMKPKQKKKSKPKERSEEAEINKPWMTEKLKTEISKKHKLYREAREKNTEESWAKYTEQRTLVGKISNVVKLEYIGSQPDVGLFFCEACDRGWNTEESLNKHKSEHRTCGVDGCTLSAHPKVIEKHIQQQHMTGLYKRITSSYDPEEITRWVTERKSRYPTKENIEKKRAQREEMLARGERMPQNTHRQRGRDRRQGFNRERGRRKRRYQNRRHKSKDMIEKEVENSQAEDSLLGCNVLKEDTCWEDNWRGDLPKFPGTAAFPETKTDVNDTVQEEFSDEEWQNSKREESPEQQPLLISQALMTLRGTYASESEDDDIQPTNKKYKISNSVIKKETDGMNFENQSKTNETAHVEKSDTIAKNEVDSDSTPEEAPIIHKDNDKDELENEVDEMIKVPKKEQSLLSEKHSNSGKRKHRINSKAGKTNYNTRSVQRRRRLTLLEKLLRKEISHERNVILQCVRYVVQNNFFK